MITTGGMGMFKNIKNKPSRRHSGQSTVEYIVLVAAVIGVLILFTTKDDSGLKQKFCETLDTGTEGMQNRADFLANTHHSVIGNDSAPSYSIDPSENTIFR